MFTRDNILWSITFFGAALLFLVMSTSLIPHDYADKVKDVAAFLGFLSGYLGGSPLKLSQAGKDKYAAIERLEPPPELRG